MPIYQYVAKNIEGNKISGVYEVDNIETLKKEMFEKGYFVTKANITGKSISLENVFEKINAKDFAIFCKQFAIILNSGISLTETMLILIQQTQKKKFKEVLLTIYEELQKGKALSNSFKMYKDIFPEFFINMIEVGEVSGSLDSVLFKLADYYEREYKVKKKIKSASRYPIMVIVVAVAVVILLMIKVVPMFVEMLTDMGGNIPFVTKLVMGISRFMVNNTLIILMVILSLILGGIIYYKTKNGRYFFDSLKLKLPLFKNVIIKSITAKFARSMGMLLKSGIPIVDAIDIIRDLIGNRVIEEKFKVCADDVKEGRGIAKSIKKIEIFPPLLFHMIAVGEKTGELDDMLMNTSKFFEEEVEDAIDQVIAMIEPIMIIVLGLIVAIIILSVMLPMVEIMQNIS